jgi:copper chaperone
MTNTTLTVPDVSCGHCKSTIEGAVASLPGVSAVTVNIEPRTVDLSFDDSVVSLDTIVKTIEEQGYDIPAEER